ncbi:calcium-binding protein [Campylobacter blaseri]|uniref:Haemolysin-type calcium binding-related domain-containing protein n=2 Tax=Campylobacter blaseri TaxID=2042961 RepID=A0A2P8QYA5_9BACT|nr:calcium-binding protein [Campylobacter blaseri]PSM51229.1 hypothetical protein CQ405_09170 [Campylobacter blaseri]
MSSLLVGDISSNHNIVIEYKDKITNELKERKYILYKFTNYYDGISNDIISDIKNLALDRVIVGSDKGEDKKADIVFYKKYTVDNSKNTFELRNGSGDEVLIPFLARIDFPYKNKEAHIAFSKGKNAEKIIVNYYANFGANASRVLSDIRLSGKGNDINAMREAAKYSLQYLKGYATEKHREATEYQNLDIYSDRHKNARVEFFTKFVKEQAKNQREFSSPIHYVDINHGKTLSAGSLTQGSIGNQEFNSVNVFVNGSYTQQLPTKNLSIFGYSDNDTINAGIKNISSIIGEYSNNVYVEGGLGSDTITTGSGNDTIYTNAAIKDEFDKEKENTTNTVNAGDGNNTINGSKAKDIVTTGKDNDTIVTKAGDDTIEDNGGINYIYAGAGSDTIKITNSKESFIYTSKDSKNGEDKDKEEDTNTVILNSGKNNVYGGKGKENITIEDGKNFVNTSNGESTIEIKGGKNQIIGGKDKDTITISGGTNTLILGNGEDEVTATGGDNTIHAGEGADTIKTAGGKDKYYKNVA